jgi:hypothetical protein
VQEKESKQAKKQESRLFFNLTPHLTDIYVLEFHPNQADSQFA